QKRLPVGRSSLPAFVLDDVDERVALIFGNPVGNALDAVPGEDANRVVTEPRVQGIELAGRRDVRADFPNGTAGLGGRLLGSGRGRPHRGGDTDEYKDGAEDAGANEPHGSSSKQVRQVYPHRSGDRVRCAPDQAASSRSGSLRAPGRDAPPRKSTANRSPNCSGRRRPPGLYQSIDRFVRLKSSRLRYLAGISARRAPSRWAASIASRTHDSCSSRRRTTSSSCEPDSARDSSSDVAW